MQPRSTADAPIRSDHLLRSIQPEAVWVMAATCAEVGAGLGAACLHPDPPDLILSEQGRGGSSCSPAEVPGITLGFCSTPGATPQARALQLCPLMGAIWVLAQSVGKSPVLVTRRYQPVGP